MNEDKIRQIATEVFNEQLMQTQYAVSSIPYHLHNGTDSPQLSQANINPYFRVNCNFTMSTDGQNYTLNLNFVANRIDFTGTAVHRTAGTIDKRAIITGIGFIGGNNYTLNGLTSSSIGITSGTRPLTIIQGCNSLTTDAAATPAFAVFSSQASLIRAVQPGTGADVVNSVIQSWSNTSIVLHTTLVSGWEITGTIYVS